MIYALDVELITTDRWGLCILCVLLILALCTSYYLQIKRIRAVHETVISIFAGMAVGLILRLSPGQIIQDMLVSWRFPRSAVTVMIGGGR